MKKCENFVFASLKSLKKGVGSGAGPDPLVRGADPSRIRTNEKDLQHCQAGTLWLPKKLHLVHSWLYCKFAIK
jgi:hypothetical protein